MYGVTSSSNDILEFIDELENIILDFVAMTMLTCASGSKVLSEGGIKELGVVIVCYPEYGETRSICESS